MPGIVSVMQPARGVKDCFKVPFFLCRKPESHKVLMFLKGNSLGFRSPNIFYIVILPC